MVMRSLVFTTICLLAGSAWADEAKITCFQNGEKIIETEYEDKEIKNTATSNAIYVMEAKKSTKESSGLLSSTQTAIFGDKVGEGDDVSAIISAISQSTTCFIRLTEK